MTTIAFNMYMEFIKGNEMNTTPYTDDVKALMTIIEQSLTDYDQKIIELDEQVEYDNTRNWKKQLLQEMVRTRKKLQETKKIVEEKDEELEEVKVKLIKVPKGSMNYAYMKDMEKDIAKLKRANELNSELWDTSQKCIGELEKVIVDKNIKCIELEDEIDEKDKNIIELEDDCDKLEETVKKLKEEVIAYKYNKDPAYDASSSEEEEA